MARILIIFTLLFVRSLISTYAQPTFVSYACKDISNRTVAFLDSQTRSLYRLFVHDVSPLASTLRFYKASAGNFSNKVYVLFRCHEDLSLHSCQVCINEATRKMLLACSLYDEGIIWYDECLFRFAYRNFFSSRKTIQFDRIYNSKATRLSSEVVNTLIGVIKATGIGTNGAHYGEGETNSSEKLFCFAECTSDLDRLQCQSCLERNLAQIVQCCNGNFRVMSLHPNCLLGFNDRKMMREEISSAPAPSSMSPLAEIRGHEAPPTSEKEPTNTSNRLALGPVAIVAIACSAAFGLVLLVAGLWLCIYQKKLENSFQQLPQATHSLPYDSTDVMDDINCFESLQLDFKYIKTSTCNFSWKNKLGHGGFGEVYKGKFSNGELFAVKRLAEKSRQGVDQFRNEVLLLAKLQHRNLVKLLGFSISGQEKLLIYEFMSNSSLDRFLCDPIKRASLEWELRFNIINGVARGLLYLHEDSRLKIIHRDLKASNILLDDAMNAKIADFGLAKIFDLDQTQDKTMRIAGTYGYMAPEYVLAGQFSAKSDVYSFGVIILEILSGQRNRFFHGEEDEELLHRAWRLWQKDTILELVDPLLNHRYCEEEVKLCIQIGLLCIQGDATLRPRMTSVVAVLNGQSVTLPSPNAPHFFTIGPSADALSSNHDLQPENALQHKQRKLDDEIYVHTGTTNITELSPR